MSRFRRTLSAFVITAAAVGASQLTASPASAGGGNGAKNVDDAMTDQIIVTYTPGAARLSDGEVERAGGPGSKVLRRLDDRTDVVKLEGRRKGLELGAAMEALSRRPGVELVEPDAIMTPLVTPNDPDFGTQWDLSDPTVSGVSGINAVNAWDRTTGSAGITVAVIDTGYVDHADLAGRFVAGYDFVSDSRIGNDGSGRDADARDPGDWISAADTATRFFAGCTVDDSSWHGTHVAGTIGAASNNGTGISGINWVSKILPVRVLGKCGGYTSDIVDGMRWSAGLPVTGVPNNPNPAKVLNLSLGGSGACSSTYQTAINAITAAGAVVVVAAGNSNADAGAYSPASCSGVVTVAAVGKAGSRSYYSNYGTSVEVAAPGGDRLADNGDTILSTLNAGLTTPGADAYVKYQGTSMATPHVAGVVSLMLSANPRLTPAQVTTILQQTARAFPGGSTCVGATPCGTGIIDAAAAVDRALVTAPAAPAAFGKTGPANGATRLRQPITLSWGASSGATGYAYCVSTSSTACTTGGTWTSTTTTSASVSGLLAGTRHFWQVRATNAGGTTVANAGTVWSFTTR